MTNEELKAILTDKIGTKATLLEEGCVPMLEVRAENLLDLARLLRDDEQLKFDFLNSLAASDTGEAFEVFYSLSSVTFCTRVDFKVILERDKPAVESVQSIWVSANWYERELWELFGIEVKNHDDLGTFLLPEDWSDGFPMRKDWVGPSDFIPFPEIEK